MSDSIFSGASTGQTSLQELAALTVAHPELAEPGAAAVPDSAPSPTPAPEPPPGAPEKPAEGAPPTEAPKAAAAAEGTPKAPEAPPAPDPDDAKPVKPSVLARLSEKAREAEAAKVALEQQLQQMQGRLDQLSRMVPQQPAQPQAQQPPEDPAPNRDEDPLGYMAWQDRRAERLEGRFGQIVQHLQGQAVQQAVHQAYTADAQAFAQQQTDFPDAYRHLFTTRSATLRALGYADQAIAQQIQREEMHIVATALQNKQSPAAVAYELAKANGYQAAAPKASPAPVAPPPTVDPVMAAAKAKAAVGIAEGGAAPTNELSLDYILNTLKGAAQQSALDKWREKNEPTHPVFRR